jgi:hypothetical protein
MIGEVQWLTLVVGGAILAFTVIALFSEAIQRRHGRSWRV